MIIRKHPDYQVSLPYEEMVSISTMADIKQTFSLMRMRFCGQPRKAQMVHSFADYVLHNTDKVLNSLSLEDLKLVKQLIIAIKHGNVSLEGVGLFD